MAVLMVGGFFFCPNIFDEDSDALPAHFFSPQLDSGRISTLQYGGSRFGHQFFSKECHVLVFFCVLFKRTKHSRVLLRSL